MVLGQDNFSIGDFIDTAACYSAIEGSVANKDGDKSMDPESYVNFVDLYGPDDLLDPSLTFEELPLILINNFYFLACLCESESDPECCVGSNAGLETNGALPGDSPTDEEKAYLFVVCAQTNTAIERVIQSAPPSVAPVTGPPVNPFEELVVVNYSIGVKNEATVFEDYEDELISAMDSMAPTLLSDMRRRQLRAGRRLQTVSLPTAITDNEVIGKWNALKFSKALYANFTMRLWFCTDTLAFRDVALSFVSIRRLSRKLEQVCCSLRINNGVCHSRISTNGRRTQ